MLERNLRWFRTSFHIINTERIIYIDVLDHLIYTDNGSIGLSKEDFHALEKYLEQEGEG